MAASTDPRGHACEQDRERNCSVTPRWPAGLERSPRSTPKGPAPGFYITTTRSQRTWLPPRRRVSWVFAWSALSVTITRLPDGNRNNFGAWPLSSPGSSGLRRRPGKAPGRRELLVPNSDRAAPATFLDDREPEWQYKKSPRATLAAWLTATENPFFSRRWRIGCWWFVFGVGLVDRWTTSTIKTWRAIRNCSKAWREALCNRVRCQVLASRHLPEARPSAAPASPRIGRARSRLFAQFPMQMLSPEQIFDSLEIALG